MSAIDNPIYYNERKRNTLIAWLSIPVALGLLVLMLRYFGLYYQIPPPPEEILEIELEIPEISSASSNSDQPAAAAQNAGQGFAPASQSEVQTQTHEEAPEEESGNNPTPSRTFGMGNRTPDDGAGGSTNDRGTVGTVPGGGLTGTGGAESGIGNRGVKKGYAGTTICNQDGYVMVKFTVDRTGKVIKTEAQLNGSTIQDAVCKAEAEKFALRWEFESDPNAPEFQVGVLPVYFKRQ